MKVKMYKSKFSIICIIIVLLTSFLSGCGALQQKSTKKDMVSVSQEEEKSLLVYSGAGLRKPMDEIGEIFKEKYGINIQYTYAGSAQNLSQIELTGEGDIYVPGSMFYYKAAVEKQLVDEKKDVAYHIPVITVPKENPANIQTLEDLAEPGIKVALGDEKANAIGKVAVKMLKENELLDQVKKNIVASTATVNELIVYISMKQADAAIVWEDNVQNVSEIQMIEIPKEKNMIKTIPISCLKNSKQKEEAQKFIDFVISKEGKAIFKKYGFKPVE